MIESSGFFRLLIKTYPHHIIFFLASVLSLHFDSTLTTTPSATPKVYDHNGANEGAGVPPIFVIPLGISFK